MKRTQISFEDWEYRALISESKREGRSMAALVREAIHSYLAQKQGGARSRLNEIRGIGSDIGTTGQEHDRTLYDEEKP